VSVRPFERSWEGCMCKRYVRVRCVRERGVRVPLLFALPTPLPFERSQA